MTDKKIGQTPGKSSPIENQIQNNYNTLSPRLRRLALALANRPQTIRELIDVIPTNNPAEYVRQLRCDYGLTIFCEHVKFTTADGETSWFGRYHLTPSDRQRLREALGV